MSYIISEGKLIAKTATNHKSGRLVRFSTQTANNGSSLVNASEGKILNAEKWSKAYRNTIGVFVAECIRDDGVYMDFKI